MKVALVYADAHESPECDSLSAARLAQMRALLETRCELALVARSALSADICRADLVLCAGGDGTLLETALCLRETPLCGIRLLPERSVGFLCAFDYSELASRLDSLLTGAIAPRKMTRLDCLVGGVSLDVPLLNDVLLAHRCPARASRYEISFGGVCQRQCSSGLWVATEQGAHGGLHSAGGVVPEMPDGFAFCVRECARYAPSDGGMIRTAAFDPALDALQVKVLGEDMCLFGDGGLFVRDLSYGQTLTFRSHAASLSLFGK